MTSVKLLALDLDGTAFNDQSETTPGLRSAIRSAVDAGTLVILSTGRPLCGIPFEQFDGCGIRYCITTNGSGIYELPSKACLFESCMETDFIVPILRHLLTLDIHFDAFIGGSAYSDKSCYRLADKLDLPPSLHKYIFGTRIRKENLPDFIEENHLGVQKVTMNFYPLPDGTYRDRDAAYRYICSFPQLHCVSGGFHNLEFTRADTNKGAALRFLAKRLHIPIKETMAVGDTENDLSIIEAAGFGVAMGNAIPLIKDAADAVTGGNEEDGAAEAIRRYVLREGPAVSE